MIERVEDFVGYSLEGYSFLSILVGFMKVVAVGYTLVLRVYVKWIGGEEEKEE